MRKIILLVAILLVISGLNYAQQETGNSLLDKLEKRIETKEDENLVDFLSFGVAVGYILGICDGFDGEKFSLPDPFNREQILDIIEKYLIEHSESRHLAGSILVVNALTEAFPIKSPGQTDSLNMNSIKSKEEDKKLGDKLARYLTLFGLFLNLFGVFLIYFGAQPYKDLPIGAQTSSKDTGYLTFFRRGFLPAGIILICIGIGFQMGGVLIK